MKLSDQAALLLLSKAFTALLLFVQGPIIVRFLTQADYGTFLQVNLLTLFMATVISSGFPQTIFYFVPKLTYERQAGFILRTLNLLVFLGLLVGVLFYAARHQVGGWMNNPGLPDLALIIGVLTIVSIFSDFSESILLLYKKTAALALLVPIKAIARLGATVVPLLNGLGLKEMFECLIVVLALESLILYSFVFYHTKWQDVSASVAELMEQARYAVPIGLTTVAYALGVSIDKFVVSTFCLPGDFAIYARGAFEFPLIGLVPAILGDVLLIRFVELWARGDKSEMTRLLRESIRRIALLFYPACCLCFVLAYPIITLLFTEGYADSVAVFRIYILVLLFAGGVFPIVFRASGNTIELLKATLIKVVTSLCLGIVFLKTLGIYAVAVAVVIAQALSTIYYLVLTRRELNARWVDLIPWNELGKICMVSVTSAAFLVPIVWWNAPKLAILITGTSLFTLAFIYLGIYLKGFSESDIAMARRWMASLAKPSSCYGSS